MLTFEEPFRHHVIDGFLSDDIVLKINSEWPLDWHKEDGRYNCKWSQNTLPPTAKTVAAALNPEDVGRIVRINGLFADPALFGAGLHCIPQGGFLKMHVDFNKHPQGWHRRVNLLIYLNEHWEDSWGGHLQLGLDPAKRIAPLGGRCVIFETNDKSWHGHPGKLACPGGVQRRSLALYFYTHEPVAGEAHSTIYIKKNAA